MFTNRQLAIIQLLIEAQGYISGEELSERLTISIKTLQKELKYIKVILGDYQIAVSSQKGKGYRLIMESKLQSEIFLNSISYFSKTALKEDYDLEYLLLSIIKKTVIEQERISLAYFEEKMYVGKKHLKGKFEVLKQYISKYNLQLSLRQGKGMQIKGASFQIQLLFVDLLEQVDNRILYGEQFLTWRVDKVMHQLTALLVTEDINIPYVKLKKICLLLTSLHLFQPIEQDIVTNDPLYMALCNSKLGRLADQMISSILCEPTKNLKIQLTKLLLCSVEKYSLWHYQAIIDHCTMMKQEKIKKVALQILNENANLFRLPITDIAQSITNFLVVAQIEQELYLQNDFSQMENLGGKTMLCEYLAAEILLQMNRRLHLDFNEDTLVNLKLILRSLTVKFSEVSTETIYVVSRKDYAIAEYIAKNLEHEYIKMVKNIHALPAISNKILPEDVIVTDIPMDQCAIKNKVLYFTTLSNFDEVNASVGNYINLSRKKSQTFFEKLNLSYFSLDTNKTSYLSMISSLPMLKEEKNQIKNLDARQKNYHISVINDIALLLIVVPEAEVEITPIWHEHAFVWFETSVKHTIIITLNKLSDFIIFDAPIFKLINEKKFKSFIKQEHMDPEDYEQQLIEIIF